MQPDLGAPPPLDDGLSALSVCLPEGTYLDMITVIIIVILVLIIGLMLGFLIGARTRQITAKMKNISKALASLSSLIRMAEAEAQDDGAAAGDDNEMEEEEGKEPDKDDPLEEFLQTDECPGLDDHGDVEVNPVIMYNIKLAKDAQRLQQRREALAAEGLSEDDIEERLAGGVEVGGGGGGGVRANPLALLISVGARVEATAGSSDIEAVKRSEMRRKQRNINVFLNKTLDIDTRTTPARDGAKGGKKQNAYDVARNTKLNPIGGSYHKRTIAATSQAKSARRIYRQNKNKLEMTLKPVMERIMERRVSIDASDANPNVLDEGPRRRTGLAPGTKINDTDLASLLAEQELGGEEGEEGQLEDDDEGDDGLEDDSEEDEELEA